MAPGLGGMMNSPGMQSLMRQMTSNPELMRNMFNNDSMSQMTRQLSQNPDFMRQVCLPICCSNFLDFPSNAWGSSKPSTYGANAEHDAESANDPIDDEPARSTSPSADARSNASVEN